MLGHLIITGIGIFAIFYGLFVYYKNKKGLHENISD